jgi:hypothetical protein
MRISYAYAQILALLMLLVATCSTQSMEEHTDTPTTDDLDQSDSDIKFSSEFVENKLFKVAYDLASMFMGKL